MITVRIDDSRARAKLQAVGKALDPARVNKTATYGVMNLVKRHLRELNADRPNKLGGKRSNFYADARRATHSWADSSEGIVAISKTGFAQRRYGGTIAAVNRQFLTIPIAPEAYGARVSDFPNAFIARLKGKGYIATKAGSGKDEPLHLLFALVRSVTQDPDPSVLPDNDAIQRRASSALSGLIRKVAAEPSAANDPDSTSESEQD